MWIVLSLSTLSCGIFGQLHEIHLKVDLHINLFNSVHLARALQLIVYSYNVIRFV